ncbi:MAG TPA: methyltransferase domain-containing protein [Acidimicrobiales bacterium]|nr:methyltransferase domain-containing protein [Acidimicrobiales bacterium]
MAVVQQFKYDFHVTDVEPLTEDEGGPRVVSAAAERRIPADADEISRTSRWHQAPPHFIHTEGAIGDTCSFTGRFTDAVIRLMHQPRGGVVDVFVDDRLIASVDLYTPEGSFIEPAVAAADLSVGPHNLVFASRGAANEASAGTEVIVDEVVLHGPPELEGFAPAAPLNFGNPYSRFIEEYTDRAAPDELVLEVGGGDRRRCLPNHANFEYLKFELADIYGDIHSLPFEDDAFAIVHSQAVFEHLADPQAAAKELIRITRPGGLIVTEVAFLQPLHAVPFHFYNMTLWGVEELFKSCELLASDWFGPLSETVTWLLSAANLTARIPPEQLARIQADFESFDEMMTHDDLKPVASGVHIAVRKPA